MSDKQRPGWAEKMFVVFVLLLSTGAFLNLFGQLDSAHPDDGRFTMQALWSLIYLVTFALLFKHSSSLAAKLKRELWLFLLVGLALCSTLWSAVPELTARRAAGLVCTTFFGLYLAERYSLREQVRLLALSFSIAALLSFIFELFELGTASDIGVPGWIGVYDQKNVLGINMAFATAVLLILRESDAEYRRWATIGAALTSSLLLLSQSVTAALMLFVIFLTFLVARGLRKSYRSVILGTAFAGALAAYCAAWIFDHLDYTTSILGRDPAMTGRVPLWILSTVMALQRPWLGYGYNAFWRGLDGPSAPIWRLLTWGPPHSHNGVIEVWLGLGLVGVAILVVSFFMYLKRAIHFLRAVPGTIGCWPLMLLTLTFLSNLTGAGILSRNTLGWLLYVAVGVTAAELPIGPANSSSISLNVAVKK